MPLEPADRRGQDRLQRLPNRLNECGHQNQYQKNTCQFHQKHSLKVNYRPAAALIRKWKMKILYNYSGEITSPHHTYPYPTLPAICKARLTTMPPNSTTSHQLIRSNLTLTSLMDSFCVFCSRLSASISARFAAPT